MITRELYPIEELPVLDQLEALFHDWRECCANLPDTLVSAQSENMVFDGFYPYYFRQSIRILFVGREARGIEGCNYLDVLFHAYREAKIGNRHLNFDAFHSRKLHIAWGLLNGMPDWETIPWASEIGKSFGSEAGISFAFMNISKLSNEKDQWVSDWEMIKASHDAATTVARNFITEEVALLKPTIVITMNLGDRLKSLGNMELIERTPNVTSYWLDSDGHRSLMLDCYHFSAPGKSHVASYYAPICKAVSSAHGTCSP